jgi:hypothetical protein
MVAVVDLRELELTLEAELKFKSSRRRFEDG